MKLEKIIDNIFTINLGIKKGENILILNDKNKRKLGKLFLEIGKKFTDKIDLIEIPVGKVNGEEPPPDVAKRMLNYDIALLITTKSLTHTTARKNACKKGCRIGSLPGVTEAMLKRALNVDYKKMHQRISKISDVIDKGNVVRVLSKKGTDLEFSIKKRRAHGRTSGIFIEKGKYGNLPDGESFIAPIEGSANGVYVVDGSLGSVGKVDKPVKIFVVNGYVVKVEGGKAAKKLLELLNAAEKEAKNIAEFGIGANDKAIISGNMLEDEKVMGTCHIALGNNSGFGGKVEVGLHIDGLIKKPEVFVDGKLMMKNGKLVL
jgi:leucyl aminopeptidase (aminopeptidase T)